MALCQRADLRRVRARLSGRPVCHCRAGAPVRGTRRQDGPARGARRRAQLGGASDWRSPPAAARRRQRRPRRQSGSGGVRRPDVALRPQSARCLDRDLAELALADHWPLPPVAPVTKIAIDDWARESWQLARSQVYAPLGVTAPQCASPAQPVVTGTGYSNASAAVIRLQVARAGARLAALLNAAFAAP